MSKTVGDFFWERLSQWGVQTIFGYPGDGINGVLGALNRAGDRFEFIQVRHEEMAAFMASAYAKFTGELGVCMATSGPGASHLLTGLYDARLDHMPVLAIAGQQARNAHRRPLPAGTRSADHVQGRRRRLCAAGVGAGAGAPSRRSRDPHRARRAQGDGDRSSPTICRKWPTKSRRASTARSIPASASPRRRSCPTTPICAAPPRF